MSEDLPPTARHAEWPLPPFKNAEYEVIGVARHSETLEPLVVYRPLYNATGWWVRPHDMFFGTVEIESSTRCPW